MKAILYDGPGNTRVVPISKQMTTEEKPIFDGQVYRPHNGVVWNASNSWASQHLIFVLDSIPSSQTTAIQLGDPS